MHLTISGAAKLRSARGADNPVRYATGITNVFVDNEVGASADEELFTKISTFSNHILHSLLPPLSTASQCYSLRQRTHFFQLPVHSTHLSDCNFLTCMLYHNCYYSVF